MSKMTTIFSHSRFPFPRYYPVSSHGLPLWEDIMKRKIKRETRSVTCPRSLSCEMHSNPESCEQLHRGTLAGGWYSATLLPIMTDIAPPPQHHPAALRVQGSKKIHSRKQRTVFNPHHSNTELGLCVSGLRVQAQHNTSMPPSSRGSLGRVTSVLFHNSPRNYWWLNNGVVLPSRISPWLSAPCFSPPSSPRPLFSGLCSSFLSHLVGKYGKEHTVQQAHEKAVQKKKKDSRSENKRHEDTECLILLFRLKYHCF